MSKKSKWIVGVSLFFFLVPFVYSLGSLEKDRMAAAPDNAGLAYLRKSEAPVIILPESFLRSYDPVTVFFAQPAGPEGGGPLDNPAGILEISPPHPGEYRWLDSRTLRFYPTVPWAPLSRYQLNAGPASRALVTLMVPPTSVTPPAGRSGYEPFREVGLSFAAYLPPDALAEMVSFEVKPLPGLSGQESLWYTSADFQIKEEERSSAGSGYNYQLTLNTPFDYGRQIELHIKLSLDGSVPGSAASYIFKTKERFALQGMGCSSVKYPVAARGSVYTIEQAVNCGTGSNPLFVEFSESIASVPVATLKQFARFEPAVSNLSARVSGNRLYLSFEVDRETPYKLSLHPAAIFSSGGRALAEFGETSFFFYYTQLSAYLKWSQGEGIVERYGPQFFPMEGRAMEKIDLRIYRIDPLNRNFWPFPSNPLTLDEDARPPMPGEEPEYATAMASQLRLLGTPQFSEVIDLPLTTSSPGSRFGLNLQPVLAGIAGSRQPGTYLVGYRLPGASRNRTYVRLTVTDLCLSTVEEEHAINFIVTSLQSGAPVAGARIYLEADFSGQWRKVISGPTDATGQFYYAHEGGLEQLAGLSSSVKRIIVTSGEDVLVLDPQQPPPYFMNNHWFGSSSSWLSWLNRAPRLDTAVARLKGYLLSERPVYRPGEPVHLIGYVRQRRQGLILPPPEGGKYQLNINGPGRKSWSYPVKLGSLGHFYYRFSEEELPTGSYTAEILDLESNRSLDRISFKVEAYRIPRFEINISGPERVPLDQVFELTLTADYYAGGRVVGQQVTWEISQYPHEVRPPNFPGYIFSSDKRFGSGYYYYDSSTKQDVTDENGAAVLSINPAAENDSVPRRYVIEATVRGADAQTVTTSSSVYALPPFIIGLKTEGFVTAEKVIRPEIIAIGHDERLLAGKALQVRIYQRQWHSYLTESDFTTGQTKYTSDVVDTLLLERELVTGDTPLQPAFPVESSGVYVVEVLGWDNLGRMQKVQADLYVAGEDPVAWQKTQANVFDVIADKGSYDPGNQATLLLKSPFQEARALVIVEAPRGNTYHWVQVSGGQGLFTFTIEKDMTPRVAVHALLMRGRLPETGNQTSWREDRGRPIAMASTSWLRVTPTENEVVLDLVHEKVVLPGSTLEMQIYMTDKHGNAPDGEVALWLVDRAVLALGEEEFSNPLDGFIDPVNTSLRIRETRNEVVGNLIVEEIPGGGGDDDEYRLAEKQSLVERTTIRKNFKTVAYYNDSIPIKGGRGVVSIQLPDNLTDFAVRAIGISAFDRFGLAKSVVSVRLPVIVQSALPRFVRPGDSFAAGGIGRVVEGAGGPASAEIQAEGLRLMSGDKLTDSLRQEIELPPGRSQRLYFPFYMPTGEEAPLPEAVRVTLALERKGDGASDGFLLELPVRHELDREQVQNYNLAEKGGEIKFPIIPEAFQPGSVQRRVLITTDPAIITILNSLDFLGAYRYGCTEQRVSKAYAQVALAGALAKIDTGKQPYGQEEFAALIDYLDTTLHENGLYSYWPGSTPYVSLTAYVVEFLALARQNGFVFDAKYLTRPVEALKAALRSDYAYFISGDSFRERTLSLTALAAADDFDSAYGYDLLVGALNSDLYSRGKILKLFLDRKETQHAGVAKLLSSLWGSAVFTLADNGRERFTGFQYTRSSWGGLVLSSQTKTLAAVARALYKAEPENRKVRLMIDELISRADNTGWGSTSDNVASLLTLGDVLDLSAGGSSGHRFTLESGGRTVSLDTKGKTVFSYSDSGETAAVLRHTGGSGPLPGVYITLSYLPASDLSKAVAKNSGFVVTREQHEYNSAGTLQARRPVVAGAYLEYNMDAILEEHVQLTNPETRYFVALSVPFAAGFEPLNPQLATSPREAVPAGKLTRLPDYSSYADDQVTFFYDTLPAGTYDFYFRLRASFAGDYLQPPARGQLMYELPVQGRSAGARVRIKDTAADEK